MLNNNSFFTRRLARLMKKVPKSQPFTAVVEREDLHPSMQNPAQDSFNILTKAHHVATPSHMKIADPQNMTIEEFDPEIMELVDDEVDRQLKSVDLIASSNIAVPFINEPMMPLGNKSSPGYPEARFFSGDRVIDQIENICHRRALNAFGLKPDKWGVNVQSLSGSIANLCVFHGLVEAGDTILSL